MVKSSCIATLPLLRGIVESKKNSFDKMHPILTPIQPSLAALTSRISCSSRVSPDFFRNPKTRHTGRASLHSQIRRNFELPSLLLTFKTPIFNRFQNSLDLFSITIIITISPPIELTPLNRPPQNLLPPHPFHILHPIQPKQLPRQPLSPTFPHKIHQAQRSRRFLRMKFRLTKRYSMSGNCALQSSRGDGFFCRIENVTRGSSGALRRERGSVDGS